MAWGDIRYDHSDIFGGRAKERIGTRKDAIGPGHPQWERALELAARPTGASVLDIGLALGHKNPKSNTVRLMKRMTDAGVVHRRRLRHSRTGRVSFVYFKV